MDVYAYLNPGEMPEGDGGRDSGVHVRAGDVAGGVDHCGDNEAADDGVAELGYAHHIGAVDGRRPAHHEHQQERRHHLQYHLHTRKNPSDWILELVSLNPINLLQFAILTLCTRRPEDDRRGPQTEEERREREAPRHVPWCSAATSAALDLLHSRGWGRRGRTIWSKGAVDLV